MFLETDVLIVGGGAAGVAASVAAAQEGVSTALIEKNVYLGGRATASAVGTVCGLYLRSNNPIPKYACSGFVKEFAEKLIEANKLGPKKNREGLFYLPYDPLQFQLLCENYLTRYQVNLMLDTTLTSIELDESKITEVFVLTENKSQKIKSKTLIDCTGEASISVAGKFDLLPTGKQQAAAHIFSIEKVEENDEQRLSLNIIRALKKGVNEGKISSEAEGLTIVPGSLRNSKVFLKLALLPDHFENSDELHAFSIDRINKTADFLINNLSAFRNSRVESIAPEIGFRSGSKPLGRYVLTEEDVLTTKKFDDGVANGSWPVEFWNENNNLPLMKYFELENYYQIPSRCLISSQATNLYFAGKNISATDFAIASARVMGTCLQTGWAAGKLAAFKALGKEENLAIGLVRKNLVIN